MFKVNLLIIGLIMFMNIGVNAKTLTAREFYEETARVAETYKVDAQSDISVIIGDNKIVCGEESIIMDTFPVIINNRTYLPVRAISEMFKADIGYDGEKKEITISTGLMTAKFTVGHDNLHILFNNEIYTDYTKKLEAVPVIDNNSRCLLPVRNIAEDVFGCDVEWDSDIKKVTLKRNYQSKRLMVKTLEDYDFTKYRPVECFNDKNLMYIIQFDLNVPDVLIKRYCDELNNDAKVKYAIADKVISIDF